MSAERWWVLMGLLDDVVGRLAVLVGVTAGDLEDEHARWEIYLEAMNLPAAYELLRRAVEAESDDNVAASVALRMLERTGEAERADWVNALRGAKREYVSRRAFELLILERIISGAMDPAEVAQEIDGWTDWLQLRVADSATAAGILDLLGEAGRTRRIRNVAKARRVELK
ncbi:hypothetical protein COUCH_06755 [Couchioplanes caeruleus]|uniref:hypothetical protein n=1 Tax=Couchioplanes caeruleus TaxID=56438 RepID=UPI0020BE4809|nr:hypothetical protein [Couchioplanes caeruleus]UQU65997.1 hypothetical protein COUCH_06755 [Couchioplanes caeruleus]